MLDSILSTQEVSKLLNVTETTIKRWADEKKIVCSKTLGGHRKFSLKDVLVFAERNGIALTGTLAPPVNAKQLEQLEFGVHTKNYTTIANIFLEELLQSDRDGLCALLIYLFKHHISFSTIVDEVIRPSLVVIGERWKRGDLEISQEHRSTHALIETLIRIAPELHKKTANGYSAVFAGPEGEYHDVGLRCLAYAFECEGWRTFYIGANTPIDTLTSFINLERPDLVCISFTTLDGKDSFMRDLKRVGKSAHTYGAKYLVGGFHSIDFTEKDFGCDHIALSVGDAVSYAKSVFDLRPGPKRKNPPRHK